MGIELNPAVYNYSQDSSADVASEPSSRLECVFFALRGMCILAGAVPVNSVDMSPQTSWLQCQPLINRPRRREGVAPKLATSCSQNECPPIDKLWYINPVIFTTTKEKQQYFNNENTNCARWCPPDS